MIIRRFNPCRVKHERTIFVWKISFSIKLARARQNVLMFSHDIFLVGSASFAVVPYAEHILYCYLPNGTIPGVNGGNTVTDNYRKQIIYT